jgi:hypothetical protein
MQQTNTAPERFGKFTASSIWKLLVGGKGKDQEFGETALTYIDEKIVEILTQERPLNFTTSAMSWGIEHEYIANEKYKSMFDIQDSDIEYFGIENPKFFPCPNFPLNAGASPDALHGDWYVEYKCPFNSTVHLKNLTISRMKDGKIDAFKKQYKDYYPQVQYGMWCTSLKQARFVSFDPRFKDEFNKIAIIEIPLDEEFIKALLKKIEFAVDCLNDAIK